MADKVLEDRMDPILPILLPVSTISTIKVGVHELRYTEEREGIE